MKRKLVLFELIFTLVLIYLIFLCIFFTNEAINYSSSVITWFYDASSEIQAQTNINLSLVDLKMLIVYFLAIQWTVFGAYMIRKLNR